MQTNAIKLFAKKSLVLSAVLLSFSQSVALANDYEVTVLAGQMSGSDFRSADGNQSIDVGNDTNIAIGFAWQDSPNGQGQILLNRVSHELDQINTDVDIIYAHFNGIAQFRQQNYVTTVGLGLGGALFDANDSEIFPSATVAVGTRYEFTPNFALVTELRAYATLTDDDSDIFCQGENCAAQVDDSIYIDTNISVGIAYSF